MRTDRLYKYLAHFKRAPYRHHSIDSFYNELGPGMEMNHDMLGYNFGDVIGIALLMRFLTTTDDRMS